MNGSLSRWSRRARTHARIRVRPYARYPGLPFALPSAIRATRESHPDRIPIARRGLLERETRSGKKARQNTCPVTRVASWWKIIQGKTGLGDGQDIPVMF